MKVRDLKIGQLVEINGQEYVYKGVQNVREKGFGKREKVVFFSSELPDREYELAALNKTLTSMYIIVK